MRIICALLLFYGCQDGVAKNVEKANAKATQANDSPRSPKSHDMKIVKPAGSSITTTAAAHFPKNVLVGSLPGSKGRDPNREASLIEIKLQTSGLVSGDYPPTKSLLDASETCAKDSATLCSEIAWEASCKNGLLAQHEKETKYWTSSKVALDDTRESYVVRTTSSCSKRIFLGQDTSRSELLPLCCKGTSKETYPSPRKNKRFEFASSKTWDKVKPFLGNKYASFQPTTRGTKQALRCGGKSLDNLQGWEVPSTPWLRWSPGNGDDLLVVTGTIENAPALIVFYELNNGDTYATGPSLILEEKAGLILTFTPSEPRRLRWSSCWGKTGEGGALRFEEGRYQIFHE